MKGLIRKATCSLGLAVLLAGFLGCANTGTCGGPGCPGAGAGCAAGGHGGGGTGPGSCCNWDLYDRCYPQRWNYVAEREVNAAFAPQVQNGHVLDQTVWNYYFEPASDRLTTGGQAHLAYLARRRPSPDCVVYVQTANDLAYDPGCPDRYAGARQELDNLRVQAVQKYLAGYTAGRPTEFQVFVHDPGDPSLATPGPLNSVIQMYGRFRGGLLTGGGGTGTSSGGAVPAAGPTR